MRTYQVISADGHVEVPATMWTEYVPSQYKEHAPKLLVLEDGSEWWEMDEFIRDNVGNLICDLPYDELRPGTGRYHFPDGTPRPGTGTAAQRLREQDIDGIDAEVLFPSVWGPNFLRLMLPKNKDAYKALIGAYNTWLAQDYCSVAPDRLIGNAILPESGVDDAIKEMERCRRMGLKTICLSSFPNGGPMAEPEDDRFWQAALDADMKLSPHINFGAFAGAVGFGEPQEITLQDGRKLKKLPSAATPNLMIGAQLAPQAATISKLILGGVFDRFPDLKLYFAEVQAGWIPYTLNFVDEWYQRWYAFHDIKLNQLPSYYYQQHISFGFIVDRLAMEFRHFIGTGNLMWGNDFPHSVGSYPHSGEVIAEIFEDVPEKDKRKVLVENPCRFFGLDPEKPLTATP